MINEKTSLNILWTFL